MESDPNMPTAQVRARLAAAAVPPTLAEMRMRELEKRFPPLPSKHKPVVLPPVTVKKRCVAL